MNKYYLRHIESQIEVIKIMVGAGVNVEDTYFSRLLPVSNAAPDALTFIDKGREDVVQLVINSKAGFIITDTDLSDEYLGANKILIVVHEPRLAFYTIANNLFRKELKGVHSSSILSNQAKIGANPYIAANVVIKNAVIGDNVIIHENVVVEDNVTIGNMVTIFPGSVIGAEAMGHVRNANGELENIPHLGGVVIADKVEVGANTCICSGTMLPTIIGKGTKIDAHCQIGHNVQIGQNSIIIANSAIGGSSIIGNNVWISLSSVIIDNVTIGDDCHIGPNTLVLKSLPEKSKIISKPGIILPNI